jgi:hypothetical protein
MLCTCSDRALRLYYFDYSAGTKKKKRIIHFRNEIKDHINGMKWQNSSFIKLNQNLIIKEQQNIDYCKLESRA